MSDPLKETPFCELDRDNRLNRVDHESIASHFEREVIRLEAENERLQVELEWWKQQPHENCDSKCDYGKRGDPKGCDCGRAEWHAKRPAHLTIVDG